MNVRVEEFDDGGEEIGDGFREERYRGTKFFFEDSGVTVVVRSYADVPGEASFLSLNGRPFDAEMARHPLLRQIENYLRARGFTRLRVLRARGGYGDFPGSG